MYIRPDVLKNAIDVGRHSYEIIEDRAIADLNANSQVLAAAGKA